MPQILDTCYETRQYPWTQKSDFRAKDYAYARVRARPHKAGARLERGYDVALHFAKEIAERRKPDSAPLELIFRESAQQWRKETRILSSLSAQIFNPHYQRIIGMGRAALPFIFSELKKNGGNWYWALQCICGENPAAESDTLPEAKAAWLRYAEKHNYL